MRATTSQGIGGPGVVIVQSIDYDDPPIGDGYDLPLRPALMGCRVLGAHTPGSAASSGAGLGSFEQHQTDPLGDFIGAVQWKARDADGENASGRDLSPLAWIYPTVAVDPDRDVETYQGANEEYSYDGAVNRAPAGEHRLACVFHPRTGEEPTGEWLEDERLSDLHFALPKIEVPGTAPPARMVGGYYMGGHAPAPDPTWEDAWPMPPNGQHWLVVAGTDERRQHELPHRTDPRIVVPFRAGTEDYSEIVCDLQTTGAGTLNFEFDHQKRSRLHDLIVVAGNEDGGWQPALLLTANPLSGQGYGLAVMTPDACPTGPCAFVLAGEMGQPTLPEHVGPSLLGSQPVGAYLSWEQRGPLHPGHVDDRWESGKDGEDRSIRPAKLWTDALWYRSQEEVGYLRGFHCEKWTPGTEADFVTEPEIRWDLDSKTWRLWDVCPVSNDPPPYKPPPEPPEDDESIYTPGPGGRI